MTEYRAWDRAVSHMRTKMRLNLSTLLDIIVTKGIPVGVEIFNALAHPPINPETGEPVTWEEVVAKAVAVEQKAAGGEAIADDELNKLNPPPPADPA